MKEQPSILIVDDAPEFREIFSAKLSAAGFKVDTADSGQAALDKLAKMTPDLVLMDVMMPGMDGATTLLKMREHQAMKDIKVVFLTSLGDPRLELNADVVQKFSKDFGAQGYLKKTENLDTLIEKIQAMLQ